MIEDLADSVEPRCRAALRVDAAAGLRRFTETALSSLLESSAVPERAAIAVWIQREVVRQHRRDHNPEWWTLSGAVWGLTPPWTGEIVSEVLDQVMDVVSARPFNSTYLLGLPYAATNELPEERRRALAGRWQWFADRADLLGYMWPGPRPDLALIIERLLPPDPGSPDPHRVFSGRCPLAATLRSELPLEDPATAELLRLCHLLWEKPPADHPALLKQVRPLLAAGGDRTLRLAVLVALAHQPVDATVWVGGRQERRRIWAAPPTTQVLGGALQALADVPEPWVDPLLGAVGGHAVLFHPVRQGRRPPLLAHAVGALLKRRTGEAAGELDRIYATYPDELRHWRWVIEKRLGR